MNSSMTAFFTEATGRVTMGDGALELTVEDARDYLYVPDARKFDKANRKAIHIAFQPLLKRPIGSVFNEIQRPDRQALDRAVLSAIGLDPNEMFASPVRRSQCTGARAHRPGEEKESIEGFSLKKSRQSYLRGCLE